VRSADRVIVVLWDITQNNGWYASVDQIDELDAIGQRYVTLRFDENDRLDADAVDLLVWESRVEHYTTLVLRAEASHDLDDDDGIRTPAATRCEPFSQSTS
jgi:hypothetical protein